MRKRILLVMTALLLVLGTTAVTVFAAGSGNVLCKDALLKNSSRHLRTSLQR